jgi:AmmeMemoRadiSam system protein B
MRHPGSSKPDAIMAPCSDRSRVRPPAVAGRFYAGEPRRLEAEVADLLASAANSPGPAPKALIAPHAGYIYSGRVAACAFASLQNSAKGIERVVLIGPAHYERLAGIALPSADAFDTPLGRVPIDRDMDRALADLAYVSRSDSAHAPEHALEVELPFLQSLLPRCALVPLLVGNASARQVAQALQRLWGGPETLIVVSSDLSHYHDYDTARRLDAATAAAIERGDAERLGPNDACGHLAIAGLLIEAAARGLIARRLALANSGDSAGARGQVVGYGAWAFAQPQ